MLKFGKSFACQPFLPSFGEPDLSLSLALAGRWPPSISQCSSILIKARSAKVAASGTTGVLSNYVYSATNVRLRELSLSYTLPALARERLRITLSLIANNVLMLHNEAPFDPELTSNTGTYYQGFDYFMPPSLRSWGFGVKVNF